MMRVVARMNAAARPVRMLAAQADTLLLLCFRNQRSGMNVPAANVMRTAAKYAPHGMVISVKWKIYIANPLVGLCVWLSLPDFYILISVFCVFYSSNVMRTLIMTRFILEYDVVVFMVTG
jgi:hypothetical protein